ncbi:hypothetical protein [Mycetocola miduiensis]|uniref:Uncharacterized protein n=1 Tax=Mycetocola miduiensis TaxID=995034 RepID=A0A1I4ZTM1_9MICO|nr:hypothetical protein [Mycetocola miduiensis]SFN53350.1 hypothetical protein SAMN05216219_1047 [Mycetocola miduiensis]
MEWWNEFVAWLTAPDTRPVLFMAAVVALAILVSALLAAAVTKAAVRRLVDQRDRDLKASAIAALIDASTEAASWNSLSPQEQLIADRAAGQADIQLRLLPVKGAAVAANWAAHQLAEMKRDSATFGFELAAVRAEFRDRLLEWQARPSRTRRVFESDLERWKFEATASEKTLAAEQDAWTAREKREKFTPTDSGEPTVTPATYPSADTTTQKLMDDVAAMDVKRAAADPEAEKKLA